MHWVRFPWLPGGLDPRPRTQRQQSPSARHTPLARRGHAAEKCSVRMAASNDWGRWSLGCSFEFQDFFRDTLGVRRNDALRLEMPDLSVGAKIFRVRPYRFSK